MHYLFNTIYNFFLKEISKKSHNCLRAIAIFFWFVVLMMILSLFIFIFSENNNNIELNGSVLFGDFHL